MNRSCELYLRVAADASGEWPDLEAAIRLARPSVLLITGIEAGADPASLRPFVSAARRLDLAVMIENDMRIAKELDADGVHLRAGSEALAEARRLLGEEKSIGTSCALSRHEAMLMAEGGADYIAFGEFGPGGGAGAVEVADMIRWWADIFEVPCVAWVQASFSEDELRGLIEAGPDYVSVALNGGEGARRYASIAHFAGTRAGPAFSA